MKTWAIFKKEVHNYFSSPIAYVLIAFFIFVTALFLNMVFTQYSISSAKAISNILYRTQINPTDGIWRPFLGSVSFILLIIIPMITMRLFAEERRSGSLELLFTYPVSDREVILGKFFASFFILLVMLLIMPVYGLVILKLVPIEAGAVFAGILGMIFLGASFLALGLWISSLSKNQIVAVVLTFAAALLFWLIGFLGTTVESVFAGILSQVSILSHYSSFAKGTINTYDVMYYICFSLFFLYLTSLVLSSRNWRS